MPSFKLDSLSLLDTIANAGKTEEQKQVADLANKVNQIYNLDQSNTIEPVSRKKADPVSALNPFIRKSDGSLRNKYIDYQKLLDDDGVNSQVKSWVEQATGLTRTPKSTVTPTTSGPSPSPSVSNKSTWSDIGNKIVDAGGKYLGTPYVWGGDALEEGGLDCSGFVYRALNDAGYNIGRTTAQGYRSYGSSVGKAEMQPGDLIFYGKGGNASHIGIYIGNGQVMHSSGGSSNTASNPGKGVTISNVDYRSDFIEARRY